MNKPPARLWLPLAFLAATMALFDQQRRSFLSLPLISAGDQKLHSLNALLIVDGARERPRCE